MLLIFYGICYYLIKAYKNIKLFCLATYILTYFICFFQFLDTSNFDFSLEIWYNINIFDPISVESIFKEIIEKTTEEKRKEKVIYSYKYVMNQWSGIEIYETDGEYLKGCSAEGHISHVYADRMSSRPRTWSDDGIDKMSRLRTFMSNGGNVYEELIKRKKTNTKLKKYDKIIQRNIKVGIEEIKQYSSPISKGGLNCNIRKLVNKIMYG